LATSPQRAYRAACPNCGAPVEFNSAASASAVCSFCRSTLVRDGEALRRIGVSAELFDDHSPLQLGASGARQGVAFTLVGRLQYGYEGGTWNEWHALFDNGRSAWLSEDNGAYVFSFDAPLPGDAPALDGLQPGMRVLADGRAWDVASVQRAHLIAAQGELPSPPKLEGDFTVVDLRNGAGEVATLDGSDPARPAWSVGRSVLLAELALQGLKDSSEKTLQGRSLECPNCGTALAVKLSTTQSLTCTNCASVVDISGGIGAELKHYQQNNAGVGGAEPLIPLGRSGPLALGGPLTHWQVVGYLERCDIPAPGDDEETSYWREYLLFNTTAGFAFLVDSDDGWSWVRPITGAPALRGEQATWQNVAYRQKWAYDAKVTWVQGEFYWRVQRDERARVTDFEGTGSAAAKRLSREKTRSEVTWSAGETLPAATVAEAFAIAPEARAALQRDVSPTSFKAAGVPKALLIIVAVIVVVMLLSMCSDDACDDIKNTFGAASTEYQQCARNRGSGTSGRVGGGSYGGWSSGGGGHK
jgi:transcription initiation factor TFIIIB Brf1 subunit/transcription initiation factor TFIIB